MKISIILVAALIIIYSVSSRLAAHPSLKNRLFFIEERIILKNLPKGTKDLHIWIPYPVKDEWQRIEDFKWEGPFDAKIIMDKEHRNRILYLNGSKNLSHEDTSEIRISFKVQRKEYNTSNADLFVTDSLKRFLKPDRLVPVNGQIKRLAKEITKGKNSQIEKIRTIYDYIIDTLTYSKDDPKICGLGDSLLTLQHKKGICTDYHSLFISLVRSLGILAKFEIGYRIPEDKHEGKLNGYHCWAKFYLQDRGWVAVDISEADKHPEKRDYFFGHIDENRVHLTSGRDIALKFAKDSKPLNFFIYPYAELNGLEFKDIDVEISYRDLKGGA